MGTIWTDDQIKAIEYTGTNVLVAAAAGSGKTAVLVERIINKIMNDDEKININQLLVVTFTNAAAAEMKERIGLAIEKKLLEDGDNERLRRQQTLLPKANITTIHAFCLSVIRNHFHALDIDPSFRIADQAECSLLKEEALEVLFREVIFRDNEESEILPALMMMYGGKDGSRLKELILSVHRTIQSDPYPRQWLDRQVERFRECGAADFSKTIWGIEILSDVRNYIELAKGKYTKAIDMAGKNDCDEKSLEVLKYEYNQLQALHLKTRQDWDGCVKAANNMEFQTLRLKMNDKGIKENIKNLRNDGKSIAVKLREDFFAASQEEIIKELKVLAPVLDELSTLIKGFDDQYRLLKKEKNCIDFNDIEHLCLKLLVKEVCCHEILPTETALMYRELFKEILIDEYQDSNLVQEYILRAVSTNPTCNNIFMVGDVKQSIYRFRQAMPELFLQKYQDYTTENGQQDRKVILHENFRSREPILKAVNYIFDRIMSTELGEINYTRDEWLNAGADYEKINHAVHVSLDVIESDDTGDNETEAPPGEEFEVPEKIRAEARLTAGKITSMMSDPLMMVTDKSTGGLRHVRYSDMVILMRSTRNTAEIFQEELAFAGIPAYSDHDNGYFHANEIKTVIGLLNVINNPLQDIYLLTVLCAPFYAFTADELAQILSEGKKDSFYHSLCLDKSNKTKQFLNDLQRWRKLAKVMPASELLWMLYEETGYYEYVGGLYDGDKRQGNLRLLYERTREFEKTGFFGLTVLLAYIEKIKISSNDFSEAKTISEDDHVVRIMSIHKSKGLEFPVVFVAGLGRKFNLIDMRKDIMIHQDRGFGPEFYDIRRNIHYPSIAKSAVRCVVKKELLSEEMRVLYVALTRAKEFLFMIGSAGSVLKMKEKYENEHEITGKLPGYMTMNAASYLEWLFMANPFAYPEMGINVHQINDFSRFSQNTFTHFEHMTENLQGDTDEYLYKNIDAELKWRYPNMDDTLKPAKISVTEAMKLMQLNDEEAESPFDTMDILVKPNFLQQEHLSASEIGTAYHLFLKQLPLGIANRDEIKAYAQTMRQRNMLTQKELDCIDLSKIERFVHSELFQRAGKSKWLEREIPFHVFHEEEGYLIQGVIDMFFEEEDGLVLVDYKTNRVNVANIDALVRKYQPQLALYRYALEKLTGKKVKETYIEWLMNGK